MDIAIKGSCELLVALRTQQTRRFSLATDSVHFTSILVGRSQVGTERLGVGGGTVSKLIAM